MDKIVGSERESCWRKEREGRGGEGENTNLEGKEEVISFLTSLALPAMYGLNLHTNLFGILQNISVCAFFPLSLLFLFAIL
jgi:hypothetical protein